MATRGPSIADLLALKWDYAIAPVATEPARTGTNVKEARKALALDAAFRTLAGNDPRPLLVLRECSKCNKTDDAILQPGADNERVLFLARWFHCVRLPMDVIQPDHPFNALFSTNESEHLFVSMKDGTKRIPLESATSRTQLCNAMKSVLATSYVKDPNPLFNELQVAAGQLDAIDIQKHDLEAKRRDLMEARIPDRKKLSKLEADIAALQKQIDEKVATLHASAKIELKPPPKPLAPATPSAK